MDEVRFVSTIWALGSGVNEQALDEALAYQPHFIAADAGTTDAGPFALGSGRTAFTREAVRKDLGAMLAAGQKAGIPVIVGSVGTAGADVHVDGALDIVRDIATDLDVSLKVAVVRSEQNLGELVTYFRAGRIKPLDPAPELTEASLLANERVVGMMGVEPIQEALRQDVDLVLAGRASDAALFAAMPIMYGLPEGPAWHAGKVAECATMACEKTAKGALLGTVRKDGFEVRPFGPGLRCTPQSVAAHSLYETSNPYLFPECGGTLDISRAVYEQADETSVWVRGSVFHRAEQPTVKLEGAEMIGYQSMIVGGIRGPFVIEGLDGWLAGVREDIDATVARVYPELDRESWVLNLHVYGRDAVMGELEADRADLPHEVGVVAEVTAPTQELASALMSMCRQPLLHHPLPKWNGSITPFACLHNPAVVDRGPVYRFSLHHVVEVADPSELFRVETTEIAPAGRLVGV